MVSRAQQNTPWSPKGESWKAELSPCSAAMTVIAVTGYCLVYLAMGSQERLSQHCDGSQHEGLQPESSSELNVAQPGIQPLTPDLKHNLSWQLFLFRNLSQSPQTCTDPSVSSSEGGGGMDERKEPQRREPLTLTHQRWP